jgi:hypothetical protein
MMCDECPQMWDCEIIRGKYKKALERHPGDTTEARQKRYEYVWGTVKRCQVNKHV